MEQAQLHGNIAAYQRFREDLFAQLEAFSNSRVVRPLFQFKDLVNALRGIFGTLDESAFSREMLSHWLPEGNNFFSHCQVVSENLAQQYHDGRLSFD